MAYMKLVVNSLLICTLKIHIYKNRWIETPYIISIWCGHDDARSFRETHQLTIQCKPLANQLTAQSHARLPNMGVNCRQ